MGSQEILAQTTPDQLVALWLMVPTLFAAIGLLVAQVMSGLARVKVGAVIAAERPGTPRRRVAMTALILAILAWILVQPGVWPVPVLLCLGIAQLLVFTTPGAHDAVLGESGVQRGWHARRFESLEEWRLTGDHLRFRLFGEWTSVPCPPEHHFRLRSKLVQLVPERESPFQD
jgi:hypothetical protein